MKKILIASAIVFAGLLSCKADYLYWQVNDTVPNVESSTLFAKVNGKYYYELATGTHEGGQFEFTGTAHSDPSFNYQDTNYYVELVTYNSATGEHAIYHSDQSFSYADLHITDVLSQMTSIQQQVWSGATYSPGAVPEPTSGLMMLVGMALLGLKRRRA